MALNKFVVCFNALERRFFEVAAVHLVVHLYRRNYYRLFLRLNFYDGDVDLDRSDDMRQLSFRKITNLMTSQNLWQNHHSFYVIEYEIRLMARKNDDLIQQNPMDDRSDAESELAIYEGEDDESAYGSGDNESLTTNDSRGESVHKQCDDINDTLTSIEND